jgi:hypothetical protein
MKNMMLRISKRIWKKKNMWSMSTVNNSVRGSKNYVKKRSPQCAEQIAWPERTYIDQYEVGHYEPKTENTSAQNIVKIRLLVGKYKKIEVVVNTNHFVAQRSAHED